MGTVEFLDYQKRREFIIDQTVQNILRECEVRPVTLSIDLVGSDRWFGAALNVLEHGNHGVSVERTPTRIHVTKREKVNA